MAWMGMMGMLLACGHMLLLACGIAVALYYPVLFGSREIFIAGVVAGFSVLVMRSGVSDSAKQIRCMM